MSRIILPCAVVALSACGPSQVGFSTLPVSVPVDDCSSAIIVQLQDDGAKGSKATAATTVALSVDNSLVSFHTDSACATAVTSIIIEKDRETAVIFVKGLVARGGVQWELAGVRD